MTTTAWWLRRGQPYHTAFAAPARLCRTVRRWLQEVRPVHDIHGVSRRSSIVVACCRGCVVDAVCGEAVANDDAVVGVVVVALRWRYVVSRLSRVGLQCLCPLVVVAGLVVVAEGAVCVVEASVGADLGFEVTAAGGEFEGGGVGADAVRPAVEPGLVARSPRWASTTSRCAAGTFTAPCCWTCTPIGRSRSCRAATANR
jgi:hypothetical protein